jgi:hypothetical protein
VKAEKQMRRISTLGTLDWPLRGSPTLASLDAPGVQIAFPTAFAPNANNPVMSGRLSSTALQPVRGRLFQTFDSLSVSSIVARNLLFDSCCPEVNRPVPTYEAGRGAPRWLR